MPEDFEAACPCCEGYGVPLGALGRLQWFRCRQCGAEFNQAKLARCGCDPNGENCLNHGGPQ